MTRTMRGLTLGIVLALFAGAAKPAAAGEGPWRLRLTAVSAQSTKGGGSNGSLGFGLGVEYRLSPRIGVEVEGLRSNVGSKEEFDIFGMATITAETEVDATPLLARLDVHLTPGRRADLYLGPVGGYVLMSDLTLRLRGEAGGEEQVFEQRIDTRDELAWGAHLGLDVRFGGGSSFLTMGATFLKLPLTIRDEEGTQQGDLDPLIFHLGYGWRF